MPILRRIRQFHKIAFSDKYLLSTNLTISVTLSAVGDVLEQSYEIYTGQLKKWDKLRTMHMGMSGFTVGIICHHWYKILDRKLPARTIKTVMQKLLLDQLICSPVVITVFFATMALTERKTYGEFKSELKSKFYTLYKAEWIVWPPAQVFNFYFLPTKYRVLYDNTISLGYDIYNSHVKHGPVT